MQAPTTTADARQADLDATITKRGGMMTTDLMTMKLELYGEIILPECECTFNVAYDLIYDADTGWEAENLTAELVTAHLGLADVPRAMIDEIIGPDSLKDREAEATEHFRIAMQEGGAQAVVDQRAMDFAEGRAA